jgi:predicted GIY-YIG superfamily endonuclease
MVYRERVASKSDALRRERRIKRMRRSAKERLIAGAC